MGPGYAYDGTARTLVPPKYMTRRHWSIIASKALQRNAPISTGNTIRACAGSWCKPAKKPFSNEEMDTRHRRVVLQRGVCTWVMWRKWINTLYKQPEFEYNRSLTIITIKDIPQPNGTRLSNCILSTQFTSPNDANNYDKPLLFVRYERSAFHVAEYMIAEMPRFSDI
jgi:hypothetical protein